MAGQAVVAYTVDRLRREAPWMDGPWAKASNVPGMLSEASAAAFAVVIDECRPATVVEIGSYLGKSTVFLAECLRTVGIPNGLVHAVDPHTGDRQQLEKLGAGGEAMSAQAALFHDHLRITGVADRVRPHVMTSTAASAGWDGKPIGFLYIDGWHSYEAVADDGQSWLPHLADDGVVVFDDYSRYHDVQAAVDDLAKAGLFSPWGPLFGQFIGGAPRALPPPRIARLLADANTLLLRRIYRPRGSRTLATQNHR